MSELWPHGYGIKTLTNATIGDTNVQSSINFDVINFGDLLHSQNLNTHKKKLALQYVSLHMVRLIQFYKIIMHYLDVTRS